MSHTSHPTVDVIIPVYNAERFIGDAIQSVLAQTYLPRKIIIVDDGSTDNTVDVVKSFNSDLIELTSIENMGISSARNIGIRASKADYIAFLDADDLWLPPKLEAQIKQLQQNPHAGVCYSTAKSIDESGKDIAKPFYEASLRGKIFEYMVLHGQVLNSVASSIIVSRDILLKTNLFDESIQFSEDFELCAQLALITDFDYVKEPHVKIRVNPSSVTRQKNWEKSNKILKQYWYYLNKYANQYQIHKSVLKREIGRTGLLFVRYPHKIIHIYSFYHSVQKIAPYLCKQLRYTSFSLFCWNVLMVLPKELFDRFTLYIKEGTIFYSKSKRGRSTY